MQNEEVVKDPVTKDQPSEGTTEEATQEEVAPTPQVGDKTPPNELLKAKQEAITRRNMAEDKVKILEKELESLKNTSTLPEVEPSSIDDERFSKLEKKLDSIEKEKEKTAVFSQYPVLKEKADDFEKFHAERSGMSMKEAAEYFYLKNGLMDKPRKGLERPTGGDKAAPTSYGMTPDEVKTLRTTNYKEYTKRLMEGKIKIRES